MLLGCSCSINQSLFIPYSSIPFSAEGGRRNQHRSVSCTPDSLVCWSLKRSPLYLYSCRWSCTCAELRTRTRLSWTLPSKEGLSQDRASALWDTPVLLKDRIFRLQPFFKWGCRILQCRNLRGLCSKQSYIYRVQTKVYLFPGFWLGFCCPPTMVWMK